MKQSQSDTEQRLETNSGITKSSRGEGSDESKLWKVVEGEVDISECF